MEGIVSRSKAEREERERREKIEREMAEAAMRAKAYARQSLQRVMHLLKTGKTLKRYDQVLMDPTGEGQLLKEWKTFIECREIPDISNLSQVNTFLACWIQDVQRNTTLENIFSLSPNILKLISEISAFIELPPDNFSIEMIRSMGKIYQDFRRRQGEFIDQGTYNLLMDLRKLYDPELGVFESTLKTDQIVHSLWGNLYSCPEHRGHYYEELNFRFRIPDSLIMVRGIYRLLKTEYDYLSDTSNSFYQPGVPSFLRESIDTDIEESIEEPRVDEELGLDVEELSKEAEARKLEEQERTTKRENWGLVTSQVEGEKKRETANRRTSSLKMVQLTQAEGKEMKKKEPSSSTAEPAVTTPASEMVHDDQVDEEEGKGVEVGGKTNEDIGQGEQEVQNGRSKSPSVSLGKEPAPSDEDEGKRKEEPQPQEDEDKDKSEELRLPPQGNEGEAEMKKDEESKQDGGERTDSSKKAKKGKGKSGANASEAERPKTEAELAKERERKEKAQFLPSQVHPNELNLRNYVIQAGVFNFKLLEIPPQPKERGSWTLHQIEGERGLKEIPFVADYIPPPVTDLHEVKKTPEEMEREAKRQEEELQKLVQLEIKVPKLALWFEPPTPVRWEQDLKVWSTDGFYDIRFNEDSLQLSFRTTKFGVLGLGHNRWSNLPYQSWEVRPNGLNRATFSLMAAMVVLEFSVENDMMCVSSLQNVGNSDVIEAAIVGKYMKHRQLIKTLRYHGLDVFPEMDSYAYVDGILLKHTAAEDHLYQCMAVGASAFNFHWSRWNMLAGREKMVYQLRERHGTATPGNYQMVLNTPRGASLINCTEVSPNYSEETMENYEYRADLLQLIETIATQEAKEKMKEASGHFVEALRVLLTSVRPLTYS